MVNRLSVKVSAPRMDGSSVWSIGLPLIVLAGRQLESDCREYFSSLLEAKTAQNSHHSARPPGPSTRVVSGRSCSSCSSRTSCCAAASTTARPLSAVAAAALPTAPSTW